MFSKGFFPKVVKSQDCVVDIQLSIKQNKMEWSKLRAFADKKKFGFNREIGCERLENILGKGENAAYQHFLLFPLCFQKTFFVRVIKTVNQLVKG